MLRYSGVPKEHPDVNDMTISASIESSMERSQSLLSSSALNWYALRITYGRELALQEYLNSEGIENFIPMHYEYTIKNERRVRKLVPAVHNLVFVRSSRSCIDAIKESKGTTLPIRYIMDREYHRPIIVPDSQMRNFMAVSANYDESLLYFEPSELNIRKGTRVRITGGLFEGVEGEFVRVRNDRRVVVTIEGVMAVATTFVHPSLVEPVIEK
jgi:transcription antitermination factor NusG